MGFPTPELVGYRNNDDDSDNDESDVMPELESVKEEDEDDEEVDETEYESVYFKYCFEGCETIDDVIDSLKSLTKYFEDIKAEGHNLREPVDSGHCFLTKIIEPNSN